MYSIIGGLAAVENVFPPVPADTAVALGAFLAHFGTVSAWAVFGVTWVANVGSAVSVYVAGRTVGRQFFKGRIGRKLLKPDALALIERLYRRFGLWGMFLSRFIPGVRAVTPPFAGIAGLGAWRAILPIAVASAVWYGMLTLAVVHLAGTLAEVVGLLEGLNRWAAAVALGVGVGIAGLVVLRRRLRRNLS